MTYAQSYESSVVWCVHVYIIFSVCSDSIINQSHHTIQDLTVFKILEKKIFEMTYNNYYYADFH